jgi:hypothetical protein
MLKINQQQICSSDGNWLRSYLQTGRQCGDKKSRVVRSQMIKPKDLVANSILYMLMRQQFQRLHCVRIVKWRVGVMKLCIIAQHVPANLDLVPEIVLNYSTQRWTSSAKIKERIYRSHLSRLETKNYLPFFLFKCFSKLVEIVGYLIPTRGRASPLIKYDRKRLNITPFMHLSHITTCSGHIRPSGSFCCLELKMEESESGSKELLRASVCEVNFH